MKYNIICLAALALMTNVALAQEPQVDTMPNAPVKVSEEPVRATSFSKPGTIHPHAYIGVRGGANLSDMIYSHQPIDRYDHFLQWQGMVGLFGHFQLGNSGFSLRPEVSFVGRADSLEWLDVRYRLKAHYWDFRLPIVYNICHNKNVSPYLMVVPQLNMAYGGKVSYRADDFPTPVIADITKADISQYDGSVMLGAGVDFLISTRSIPLLFSVEAGYNMGLFNTFAQREILDNPDVAEANRSIIRNNFFGAKLWQETRHSRGIEMAVRLAVPIDGSRCNKKDDMVDQVIDSIPCLHDTIYLTKDDADTKHDTIVLYNNRVDTVYVKQPVHVGGGLDYVSKDCYSVSEMKSFLVLGVDISDKRLCLFNVHFNFDSYVLRQESYAPLNEVADLMRSLPDMKIEIYGHTDSLGNDEYNERLSLNRAKSVIKYLVSQGIDESRMKPFGFGETHPIATNSTAEGREQNRRVEIELVGVAKLTND